MATVTKNGKKVGRPYGTGKLRTPENADRVCEMLEQGVGLKQIAKALGFSESSDSEIVRWGNDVERAPEFAQRYARAMLLRWERMAEQVIEIADEIGPRDSLGHLDTGWVQQQRLRSDNRKWLLSKMVPRKYGDKVTAEITGNPDAPLITRIELVAVAPKQIEPPTIEPHEDD